MGKSTMSMVNFNSYVKMITRGYYLGPGWGNMIPRWAPEGQGKADSLSCGREIFELNGHLRH